MSPLQTDLNSKTLEAPSIIIQGNETRKAKNQSARKTKIIAATVLVSILIIGGITFGAIAYSYRLFYKTEYKAESRVDGDKIPEHIYVDYKKEIIHVKNKQSGRIDGMKALYNYNRKLVALYDETQNLCLIDKVDESFDEALKYWSTYKGIDSSKENLNFNYSLKPINRNVLLRFGGEDISYHCGNTNTTSHWVLRVSPYKQNELDELKSDADMDKESEIEDDEVETTTNGKLEDDDKRVKRAIRYYRCRYYNCYYRKYYVVYRGRLYYFWYRRCYKICKWYYG